MRTIEKAWTFFRREFLLELRSRYSLLFQLLNIALTVSTYLFLTRFVEGETVETWMDGRGKYFPFVLVGMATNGAMVSALTGLSRSLHGQQHSGFLKPLLFSQTRPAEVVLHSSLYPMVRGVLDFTIYLLLGCVLVGLPLGAANLPSLMLMIGLSVVAFAGLGLWAAAFTVLFRIGNPVLWVISSASWLLSGVIYPVSILPPPLQWLAQVFPLTHALRGIRLALFEGASLVELRGPIFLLGAFCLTVVPLGFGLFRLGLRRARVYGTL